MNTPNDELALLRDLRALPREREPAADLWAGIASRLTVQQHRQRHRWRVPVAFAAAASLALVAVFAIRVAPQWTQQPAPPRNDVVLQEANAITREYSVAFEQLGPLPDALQPAAAELERSAQDIHGALQTQPDAAFLLMRLRSTYEQRLKLGQRYAMG